jgi:membrane protease YdiL (CAAX protease family)
MNTGNIDLFFIVIVAVLALVEPFIGTWKFGQLCRGVAAGRTKARQAMYRWTMIMEWVLALGFLLWWQSLGRSSVAAGLGFLVAGWQWVAVAVGLGMVAFLIFQLVTAVRQPDELLKARGKMVGLEPLIPRTRGEMTAFTALSVSAGICEEILYRGLLMGALQSVVGLWPAVIVSSVIFGLGHAYQGSAGILKTGLIGLVMALLVVFSGSLWIAILVHAVLDIASGRIMSAALALPDPGPSEANPAPELS